MQEKQNTHLDFILELKEILEAMKDGQGAILTMAKRGTDMQVILIHVPADVAEEITKDIQK